MRTLGRACGLLTNGDADVSMTTDAIILHLRMPRVFLGFMVGCSLASVGVNHLRVQVSMFAESFSEVPGVIKTLVKRVAELS